MSAANRYSQHDAQAEIDGCHHEIARLEAVYHTWRAHAEALAGAAQRACAWGCLSALDMPGEDCDCAHHELGRVLARLPADALAERRALEGCAQELPDLCERAERARIILQSQQRGHWDMLTTTEARAALAALAAARKETP